MNTIHETLASMTKGYAPQIGDGATILYFSDRRPATVVDIVSGGNIIIVQEDNAVRTDTNGMSEVQSYTFSRNAQAAPRYFKKNKFGRFCEAYVNDKGKVVFAFKNSDDYVKLQVGRRGKYHDFSF